VRILDLFSCAGGAATGYHRAGFDVVGVDIWPQPNYPFEFVHRNALMLDPEWVATFDAIHASPPCQFGSAYLRRGFEHDHINLIPQTRQLLEASGLPYVIENIPTNAEHLHDPAQLCGSTFGLDIRRHRLFETNWPLVGAPCNHRWQTPRFPQATNRSNLRSTVEVGAYRCHRLAPAAMGIDWMTNHELSEAIPPAYTEFIGRQLAGHIRARAAA
jgi:DNA (cytosine-5)-methyltransferase 1